MIWYDSETESFSAGQKRSQKHGKRLNLELKQLYYQNFYKPKSIHNFVSKLFQKYYKTKGI